MQLVRRGLGLRVRLPAVLRPVLGRAGRVPARCRLLRRADTRRACPSARRPRAEPGAAAAACLNTTPAGRRRGVTRIDLNLPGQRRVRVPAGKKRRPNNGAGAVIDRELGCAASGAGAVRSRGRHGGTGDAARPALDAAARSVPRDTCVLRDTLRRWILYRGARSRDYLPHAASEFLSVFCRFSLF